MINDKKVDAIHDFSFAGAPSIRYLICSTQRTGSTLLCRLLTATGLAGFPEEYLRHDRIEPWLKRLGVTGISVQDYLREIEKRRTTSNGVFGIKIHYRDYVRFFGSEEARKNGETWIKQQAVIFVRRKDKLSQAISFYKAVESNIWSIESADQDALNTQDIVEQVSKPVRDYVFSPVKISRYLNELIEEDELWRQFLSTHPNGYLEVWYEDLIENPEITVRNIFTALNINTDHLPPVVSTTKCQADDMNRILKEKFIAYCRLGFT